MRLYNKHNKFVDNTPGGASQSWQEDSIGEQSQVLITQEEEATVTNV